MSDQVIVRGPGEGRTRLVGGSDYVTYKVRSEETGGAYFCFEIEAVPGFGPPPHHHAYHELFHVLEGAYEFMVEEDGGRRTFAAPAGTSVAMPPGVVHTFRAASEGRSRMLIVHQPAALEGFFEECGLPVEHAGEPPAEPAPPDPATMVASLERNGVHVVGAPASAG